MPKLSKFCEPILLGIALLSIVSLVCHPDCAFSGVEVRLHNWGMWPTVCYIHSASNSGEGQGLFARGKAAIRAILIPHYQAFE